MLCFELLAKKNRTWTLHYTAGAVAETDVPETLLDLLKQVGVGWAGLSSSVVASHWTSTRSWVCVYPH